MHGASQPAEREPEGSGRPPFDEGVVRADAVSDADALNVPVCVRVVARLAGGRVAEGLAVLSERSRPLGGCVGEARASQQGEESGICEVHRSCTHAPLLALTRSRHRCHMLAHKRSRLGAAAFMWTLEGIVCVM